MTKICTLFGLWSIEKHLGTLYEGMFVKQLGSMKDDISYITGGFATGPCATRLIRKAILQLCLELKPDAVAVADALAPPDFILNSALGQSDGEVSSLGTTVTRKVP